MKFTIFATMMLLFITPVMATGPVETKFLCPSEKITLGYGVNLRQPERICIVVTSAQTGETGDNVSVKFWEINSLGKINDFGQRSRYACWDFGGLKYELRAGWASQAIHLHSFVDPIEGEIDDFLRNHAFTFKAPKLDVCKPECEQTPEPTRELKEGCTWICHGWGHGGKWQVTCDGFLFDRGGNRIPLP